MSHAYPSDLARVVDEQLCRFIPDQERATSLGCISLDRQTLEQLLSICYQASLMREEERPVTFRAVVADPTLLPASEGPPSGLHRLLFRERRTLNEQELRRLAPAAKLQRSLIGLEIGPDREPAIWGLAHSGPRWLKAIQGGRGFHDPSPPLLTISVTGPGRMLVSRGSTTLAKLAGGQLSGPSMDVFDSRWLPDAFRPVRQELLDAHAAARAAASTPWAPLDPDLPRMIGQHFIRRIIATVRLAHHGGTLLVVPPPCSEGIDHDRYINLKYRFEGGEPSGRFRTLITQIMNALAAAGGAARSRSKEIEGDQPGVGWAEYNATSDPVVAALDEGVFELAHLVAGLADVDGAVVVTQRFALLGFGGEITGELPDVRMVRRSLDLEADRWVDEPTDGVGTRHRSVYRLCQAFKEALAVVVSQDGGVRFVRWHRGAVTVWDQLSIGTLEL